MVKQEKPLLRNSRWQEELLLKEYEVCENFASHIGGLYWQITALFLPIAFGSLALVVQVNIAQMAPLAQKVTGIIIAIAGVSFVFLLRLWLMSVLRAVSYQRVSWFRAREIEKELHLLKNRYIYALDNWFDIGEEERKSCQRVHDQFGKEWKKYPRNVHRYFHTIFWVGSIAWILATLLKIWETKAWTIVDYLR